MPDDTLASLKLPQPLTRSTLAASAARVRAHPRFFSFNVTAERSRLSGAPAMPLPTTLRYGGETPHQLLLHSVREYNAAAARERSSKPSPAPKPIVALELESELESESGMEEVDEAMEAEWEWPAAGGFEGRTVDSLVADFERMYAAELRTQDTQPGARL